MKRIILSALLVVGGCAFSPINIQAQTYGGALVNHDIMMHYDFASLSQTQVFGTARSMAMGGAFTSLGGDVSSITINPAGLGMFSHEVLSLTPMVSISDASTAGVPSWKGNNKSSFGFSNMGATFKVAENSSGSLVAVNAGFSYNRLADYNSHTSFTSESLYNSANGNIVPSINDIFMYQLTDGGIYPTNTEYKMDYDNNPYYWSAQGAYNTLMVDPKANNAGWTTNAIGHNASMLGSYEKIESGRTDEYSFALGANIGNFLYLGGTLSLQEITQETEYLYQEEYNYNDNDGGYAYESAADTEPLASQALYSNLWQRTKLSGVGANLKLGAIIRPTNFLRLGIAYHSPTYYTITRTYQVSSAARFIDNSTDAVGEEKTSTSPELIDEYEYSWKFRTPSKLLLGGSLQFGNFGVISVDYERQWYNWTRVSNSPGDISNYQYQMEFEDYYQPTSTLRLGIEVKPLPTVALRAGGGFTSSMLNDDVQYYSSPVATDSNYFTCGVGFYLSETTTLDLAYQYYHQNYSSYYLFYAEDSEGVFSASNKFNTSMDRNYITASFTFRL